MRDQNIKAVLQRAVDDRAYLRALLTDREAALRDVALEPHERTMLLAATNDQLLKMVEQGRAQPWDRRRLVRLGCATAAGAAVLAAVAPAFLLRTRGASASPETAACASCKAYAEAQEIYHRTDYQQAGVLQYAQHLKGDNSLFETKAGLGDIVFIDKSFAMAEGSPSAHPKSKAGYCFKILTAQGPHAAGGAKSYIVTTPEGKAYMTQGYALVAYPAEYDRTGRDTFIINHQGTIYQTDLGRQTHAIVEQMTEFDPDPAAGWTPAD